MVVPIAFFLAWLVVTNIHDAIIDRPYKDQLERVTKIIPYVSKHKADSYQSDEAIVARLLVSRQYLDSWERRVAAIQLLDKHDPERLRLHIAELEQQLGISNGQPDTDMGKRRNLLGRRARGTS